MVEIQTTTAGYSFKVTPTGLIDGTRVGIRPYTEKFRHITYNSFTRQREVNGWYRLYDPRLGRLYLPIYDLNNFLRWLFEHGVEGHCVKVSPTHGDSVAFEWSGEFSYRTETQRMVVEGLEKLSEGIFPIAAQTGAGKSVHISTPIKTPLGWTLMKDLSVGDQVTAWDGTPTTVTGVYPQGVLPAFLLTTEDGRSVRPSGDHLWKIWCDGEYSVITTQDIIELLNTGIDVYLPMNEPEPLGEIKSFDPDIPVTNKDPFRTVLERNLSLLFAPLHIANDRRDEFVDYCRSLAYNVTIHPSDRDGCFTYKLDPSAFVKIKSIVPDGEAEMQCISVDHPDKLFVCKDYLVTHNTVSIFRSSMVKNIRTMVTMRTRLDQWESEFFKFTNASEKQLYIIKGRPSLERLVMFKEEGQMPDFIVASIQTMRKYVTGHPDYAFLPNPREFTDYFGIGMVGMDEFHEHLESNYLMMLCLNPAIWCPITATFTKKDEFLNQIAKGFAPVDKRVGANEYRRYVDIYGYECDGGYGVIEKRSYMGPRGYSGTKLEKFFMKKGKKFFKEYFKEYFVPLFKEHYMKKRVEGDRVFILFTLVEMCYWFQKLMTEAFPEIQSAVYVAGVDREVLTQKELIITTPGSGGTGTDAPNVRSCFSFVAMAQETPLIQHVGRIRYDKNYTKPYDFVYCYFSRVDKHMDYELIREPLYQEKGLTYSKRNFPP